MSPPRRDTETSGPHQVPLEVQVAVVMERMNTVLDRFERLPCVDHERRLNKLSAETKKPSPFAAWIERNWKALALIVLPPARGAPQVRGRRGEQSIARLESAVQRLEAKPQAVVKVPVPTPVPVPVPSNGGE